jgi:hypothetical protein
MADLKTIQFPIELHEELKKQSKLEAERLHLARLSLVDFVGRMLAEHKKTNKS